MLQGVHMKRGLLRASSLYCTWICEEHAGGVRLVALWIDSEMGAFDEETSTPEAVEQAKEPPPRRGIRALEVCYSATKDRGT